MDGANEVFNKYFNNLLQCWGDKKGNAATAKFNYPRDSAFDSKGNLFVADYGGHGIRKITPQGIVAGHGSGWTWHQCSSSSLHNLIQKYPACCLSQISPSSMQYCP
jgi:hypothetical protein